jgi:hypothetical protein
VEYFMNSKIDILHQGKEPSFVIRNGKEVIDLTLRSGWVGNMVKNYHVSDELSCRIIDTFCSK